MAAWRTDFHLTSFVQGLESWDFEALQAFRGWVRDAPEIYVRLLEALASGKDPMRIPFPTT